MRVTLSFRARDIHELACHHVADSAGLYSARGLDVRLSNANAPQDADASEAISVACGSAAMRWLGGEPVEVVFVATARPMFWLYAHRSLARVQDLGNRTIATYPEAAPPAHFLRIVLEDAGLLAERGVTLAPAAGDAARLAMLLDHRADAAVISSATPQARLEAQGLRRLLCLGDAIRLPTTGLAVTAAAMSRDAGAVDALRDCLRNALSLVHSDARLVCRALCAAGLVEESCADAAVRLLRAHLTRDGLIEPGEADAGIRRLAAALGTALPKDPAALYLRSYRGAAAPR